MGSSADEPAFRRTLDRGVGQAPHETLELTQQHAPHSEPNREVAPTTGMLLTLPL